MSLRLKVSGNFLAKRLKSVSFTPNSEIYNLANPEQQVNESDIPSRPDVSLVSPLYTDMINPKDVQNIFLRPTFEDVVVTCLSKDSYLFGDSSYALKSKSSVSLSKFLFAQLTTEWVDHINDRIYTLSEVLGDGPSLTYGSNIREEAIRKQFDPLVLQNYERLDAFCKTFFEEHFGTKVSLENIVQFLLSNLKSVQEYQLVMKFLANNTPIINSSTSQEFISIIVDDLLRSITAEKVDAFSLFLTEHLIEFQPDVLNELSPKTLNDLAYVTSASSDLSTAGKTMELLVKRHKMSPLKATFDLFMSRYCKLAQSQKFTKDQVLNDLADLKIVFFHRGLDANTFKLLLNTVVDNVHDLAHCITLTQTKSSHLLSEFSQEILQKLHTIQKNSLFPKLTKAIQVTQIVKTLAQSGAEETPEVKHIIEKLCLELAIPTIHL